MRFIILVLLATFAQVGKSQNFISENFPTTDGRIIYTGVVEVDTALKSLDLYLNAKRWLVDAFKSSKSVTQIDDKDLGVLVVKSYLSLSSVSSSSLSYDGKLWFILKIETKDHRYRYTLSDIRYEATATSSSANVGPITAHVDEELEPWMNNLELPKSVKKKELFIEQYHITCKKWNSEFEQIIISLDKGMRITNTKDW